MKRINLKLKKESAIFSLLLLSFLAVGNSFQADNRQSKSQSSSIMDFLQFTSLLEAKPLVSASMISKGEKNLIARDITPEKQTAAKAFLVGDYAQAVFKLEQSLIGQPNDPEALIYLNNARIANEKAYNLAVPVPIGTEDTTAKEILRGVAQAQNEINQQGGINGIRVKITIANDDNDPETAEQIAKSLVEDQEILGVIGHYSSDSSLASAPIYQRYGLVAISPTSTSPLLTDAGSYIFRTVPSDRFTSKTLSQYIINQNPQSQVAVIYNSQSVYSQSLKNIFTSNLAKNAGETVLEIDLSQENFNAAEILQEVNREGAEVLVFLNDSKSSDRAYLLVQLNNSRLPMAGGTALFRPQTLQIGGQKANGMVLGVPWHISSSKNSDFLAGVNQLWRGDVGWRTAMAYDSTKALIAGLSIDPSRQGIQKALSQPDFAFEGASGTVKFLDSGDRNQEVELVTVQPGKRSSFGYDFVSLNRSETISFNP
ncbi:MAG: ABC transporter substrate-binding protein [Waterburya sp.]